MQKIAAVIVFVVLVFFVLVVSTAVLSYSGLLSSSQEVDKHWKGVQDACKERADLIPRFAILLAAKNFDSATLTSATDARASLEQVKIDPNQAPTEQGQLDQFDAAQSQIFSALSQAITAAANSPGMKDDPGFRQLQAEFEATGKLIGDERRKYNEAAANYNGRIRRFPVVMITRPMGFESKAYFKEDK